jgi:hypothetical protein
MSREYPLVSEVYAEGDKLLWTTQKQYEEAVKKRINAENEHSNAMAIYRDKLGQEILRLKDNKTPVSILKDLAKSEVRHFFITEIKAKSLVSQCYMECEYLLERINSIKKIMKEKPGSFN